MTDAPRKRSRTLKDLRFGSLNGRDLERFRHLGVMCSEFSRFGSEIGKTLEILGVTRFEIHKSFEIWVCAEEAFRNSQKFQHLNVRDSAQNFS